MHDQHNCDMQSIELINPAAQLSDEMRASMDQHREQIYQVNREQQALNEQLRPSREELLLKKRIRQRLVTQANLDDDVGAFAQLRKDRIQAVSARQIARNDFLFPNLPPMEKAPVAGQSQLWWARTSISYPSRLGMTVYFEDDGIHITGEMEAFDGDLYKTSLQVIGEFVLDTDRMPDGTATRFVSSPPADLYGTIDGIASVGGPLDFGDYWAKCWLTTKQIVYWGDFPFGRKGNMREENRNLVFSEDDVVFNNLPGFLPLPSVDFQLDRSHTLFVTVIVSFDFQLEGDGSVVRIGHRFNGDSAVLRLHQWNIQPI